MIRPLRQPRASRHVPSRRPPRPVRRRTHPAGLEPRRHRPARLGFLVERFGLYLHEIPGRPREPLQRNLTLIIGVAFILLGVLLLLQSVRQYRRVVQTLGKGGIPDGYWVHAAVLINISIAFLGIALAAYLVLV